jgi:hypothetical protein
MHNALFLFYPQFSPIKDKGYIANIPKGNKIIFILSIFRLQAVWLVTELITVENENETGCFTISTCLKCESPGFLRLHNDLALLPE